MVDNFENSSDEESTNSSSSSSSSFSSDNEHDDIDYTTKRFVDRYSIKKEKCKLMTMKIILHNQQINDKNVRSTSQKGKRLSTKFLVYVMYTYTLLYFTFRTILFFTFHSTRSSSTHPQPPAVSKIFIQNFFLQRELWDCNFELTSIGFPLKKGT